MAYMTDPRRADPRSLMPECRSILVLAIRYANPGTLPGRGDPAGRVAAYAWGSDYHAILMERMHVLGAFIEELVGHPVHARYFTDSGPLLERELAQRAGLGWIGRNTCLIHPVLGSAFFLAEILLDIDMEPDAPFPYDRCGQCTRCVDACPTGALLPDRTMDARRCISYLTIENRSAIPLEFREKLGDWIFGCDICQVVCPWNQKVQREGDPAFSPSPEVLTLDPMTEMGLTAEAFRDKYRHSPLLRARWAGHLRNTAVVLGNLRSPAAIPVLERAASSDEALVREHAAWALEKIKR